MRTEKFRFCGRCGARLTRRGEDGGARCESCGKSWYDNPAPTAGCVIVRDGRALITKRARDPEKGRFDIPGGFLDPEEDPITALEREVKEELSMTIDVTYADLVHAVPHRYGEDGDWVLAMGFVARHSSGEPVPADDVEEVRWVTAEELEGVDFAWEHDRQLVKRALSS